MPLSSSIICATHDIWQHNDLKGEEHVRRTDATATETPVAADHVACRRRHDQSYGCPAEVVRNRRQRHHDAASDHWDGRGTRRRHLDSGTPPFSCTECTPQVKTSAAADFRQRRAEGLKAGADAIAKISQAPRCGSVPSV